MHDYLITHLQDFQVGPDHGLQDVRDDVCLTLPEKSLLAEIRIDFGDFGQSFREFGSLEKSPENVLEFVHHEARPADHRVVGLFNLRAKT